MLGKHYLGEGLLFYAYAIRCVCLYINGNVGRQLMMTIAIIKFINTELLLFGYNNNNNPHPQKIEEMKCVLKCS